MLKAGTGSLAVQLLTQHNIAYMMDLTRRMRSAIMDDSYADFVRDFVGDQYRGADDNGGQDVPVWVREALSSAGIEL